MNKKQAIAYAQITLDYMQSSKYKGVISVETFGNEMEQAFRIYPSKLATSIAENILKSTEQLEEIKNNHKSTDH